MSIIFNGKNHDKVYFNGKYHDKIYHGSTLVWQKGTSEEPPANLYDPLVIDILGYMGGGGTLIYSDANARTTYFTCEPNTTYTITMYRVSPFRVASCDNVPVSGGSCYGTITHTNHNNSTPSTDTMTYTTSTTTAYITIYYWAAGYGTIDEIRNSIVITKA